MARTLLNANDTASIGGTNAEIVFNAAGTETLSLDPGTTGTIFGFQRGGETIVFEGPASNYDIKASGANVTITALDGTSVTLTVGSTAGTISFAGGADDRSLAVVGGAVVLGNQTLVNGALTDITPGAGTYIVAAQDGFVQHSEGTTVTYVITRTTTTSAESLTFSVAGDNNNGTVPPAIAGTDFTVGSATVNFAIGQSTATFTVDLNSDLAVEGVEGYKITVFKGAQVVATSNQLVADATNANNIGQTFQLTGNVDTMPGLIGSGGSSNTNGNDTIVGTQATLGALDNIDAGAGDNDTLQILDTGTGNVASFNFVTVKNVENLQYTSTRGFDGGLLDTTGFTGLKTLTAVIDTGANQTIKSTTAMTKMTVVNSDDGNLSFIGGGGVLDVATVDGSNVNVGQDGPAADNNFTAISVKGGESISIRDTKDGASLTTVSLDGFDDDATIDADGLTTLNVKNVIWDTANNHDLNITDAAAAFAINLSNIDSLGKSATAYDFFINVNSGDAATINAVEGIVEVEDITVAGSTLTLNAQGTDFLLDDVRGTALTTLNLNATGGSFVADELDGTNAVDGVFNINITGSGNVTIDTVIESDDGGHINGGTATGNIYIDDQLGDLTKFTGGSGADNVAFGDNDMANDMGGGDDTVRLNAGDIDGTISGGAGKDTLVMTSLNAATITAGTSGLSNFEVLSLTPSQSIPQTDTINLANAGFTTGVPTYVISAGSAPGFVQEEATVSFSGVASGAFGLDGADTLTFSYGSDSTSVTFENKDDAVAMASEFAAALNADVDAEWDAVDNGDGTVTLTHTAGGFTTDLSASNFVFSDKTTPGAPALEAPVNILNFGTSNQGEDGVVGVKEVWRLDLDTITLNPGETLSINEIEPVAGTPDFIYTNGGAFPIDQDGGALADAIVAEANADADFSARWTAVRSGNDVVFTRNATGESNGLEFTSPLVGGDIASLSETTPGVTANTAEKEQAYFTFDGKSSGDDQVIFDNQTITFEGDETIPSQLRDEFIAQYNSKAIDDPLNANDKGRTWTASAGLGGTVILTSTQAEARTDLATSDFKFVDDVSVGTGSVAVSTDTQGSTGSIVLDNFLSGGTLELTGGGVHVVNLNDTNGAADDTFNLFLSGGALFAGQVTAAGFETVNLDTGADAVGLDSVTLNDAAAKTIVVTGSDGVDLLFNGTAVTLFDASGSAGLVQWTSAGLTGAATIKTGSGGSDIDYSSATKSVTFIGGSGDDVITNNVSVGTIDISAGGSDEINVAAPINGNTYSNVIGFSSNDSLDFGAEYGFDSAKITLNNTAVFQDFLDAATAGNGLNPAENDLAWFQFGGNTYVVQDNSTESTFQNGSDSVIQLQGLVDLSGFVYTGGTLHFA
jgi:hypothetical protein